MKYLLPTAKEMTTPANTHPHHLSPESQVVLTHLTKLSPTELATGFAISETAALKEAERFQALRHTAVGTPALCLFNGLMYRQINRQLLSDHQAFIHHHLFITSSLYGIIPATQPIAPHRLDFHNRFNINQTSLKAYWRPHYDDWLAQVDEPVISLLSNEFETVFSSHLAQRLIHISFQEEKDGQLKTHSTISKKGRGLFLNQVIQQEVTTIETIKQLAFGGFYYRHNLSSPDHLVFVRQVITDPTKS